MAAELARGDLTTAELALDRQGPQARALQDPVHWRGSQLDALLDVESLVASSGGAPGHADETDGLYI